MCLGVRDCAQCIRILLRLLAKPSKFHTYEIAISIKLVDKCIIWTVVALDGWTRHPCLKVSGTRVSIHSFMAVQTVGPCTEICVLYETREASVPWICKRLKLRLTSRVYSYGWTLLVKLVLCFIRKTYLLPSLFKNNTFILFHEINIPFFTHLQ